ncbi:MAG: hypothetical protein KAI43_03350 [Candidatus Aureabacteria bacterium]|nr:hypothetical protein [Candidatus Auribacterota bacterium]
MKGAIKSVLAEELDNSLRMKRGYEGALKKLPVGCLAKRKIKGHEYYYLAKREGKKVKFLYKGKLSKEEINKYEKAKMMRKKYRKLLSQAKKQIKFLKGVLRGKEPV